MKTGWFLVLALAGGLAGGCASPNLNPAHARPHTGYVDFYAVNADNLSWDITDVDRNVKIFYEFEPVRGPILRLAFKPGEYHLRVTFLNHAILKPGVADVVVRDGMVTPVTVTLLSAGTPPVEHRNAGAGRTDSGRDSRHPRIGNNPTATYEINVEPRPPLPYQLRAKMPYAVDPDN